jgi:hypothetical protein
VLFWFAERNPRQRFNVSLNELHTLIEYERIHHDNQSAARPIEGR